MPWARLDDRAITNLKLRKLSHPAFRVWALGLVHCAAELTDGFIAQEALDLFPLRPSELEKATQELCVEQLRGKAPLWRSVEGGYEVHDYLTWNNSREHVENKRRSARERMERVRANKAGTSGEVTLAHTRPDHTSKDPSPSETEGPRAEKAKPRTLNEPVARLQATYEAALKKNLQAEKVHINYAKAGNIFKVLVEEHGEEVVTAALQRYMAERSEFLVSGAWQIGVFSSQFNRYISNAKPAPKTKPVSAAATGVVDDWTEFDGTHAQHP